MHRLAALLAPFVTFAPDPPAGGAPPAEGAPPAPPEGGAPPAPTEPPAGGAPPEPWTPPTREEWERTTQSAAEAHKQLRETTRAQQEAERQRQEEAGEFKTIAEAEQAKNAKLATGIKTAAVESTILDLAGQDGTRFATPSLALKLVDMTGIEPEFDEDTAKAKLTDAQVDTLKKRLADLLRETPGLAAGGAPPARRQLPGAGGAGGAGPEAGAAGHSAMNDVIRGGR